MKSIVLSTAACALFSLTLPAEAHHSFAMFDRDKNQTITGTVKEVDIINPHGWLQIMVPDSAGTPTLWSLEMGGAGQMERQGWDQQTVKAGDKVSVTLHPLKDGSNGGQLVSVLLPNGKTLGTGFPGFGR